MSGDDEPTRHNIEVDPGQAAQLVSDFWEQNGAHVALIGVIDPNGTADGTGIRASAIQAADPVTKGPAFSSTGHPIVMSLDAFYQMIKQRMIYEAQAEFEAFHRGGRDDG